jgi:hypothetical protein
LVNEEKRGSRLISFSLALSRIGPTIKCEEILQNPVLDTDDGNLRNLVRRRSTQVQEDQQELPDERWQRVQLR